MSTKESKSPIRIKLPNRPASPEDLGREMVQRGKEMSDSLAEMGRFLDKKRQFIIDLPGDLEVQVTATRGLTRGWKLGIEEEYENCSNCRIAKRISKKNMCSQGMAVWLKTISQMLKNHGSHKVSSDSGAESPSIVVHSPSEQSTSRIRVLTPQGDVQAASSVAVSPARPAVKLKVKEAAPASTNASTALQQPESRVKDEQSRHSAESSSVPSIPYQLPSGTWIDVTILRPVCEQLMTHCRQSLEQGTKREVGGLLIGQLIGCKSENLNERTGNASARCQIIVSNFIKFRAADSSGAHLHLSADSWKYVYQRRDELGSEEEKKVTLGWYHTHPTQGIFFSKQDHDFHTEFRLPHQFAIVVNPQNMEAGLFYWDDYSRHSLTGTRHFSLKGERETSGPANPLIVHTYSEIQPTVSARNPVALTRVSIFMMGSIATVAYMFIDSVQHQLRPMQVCILAAVALLGFRLWNMGWFHPDDPVEVSITAWGGRVIEEAGRDSVNKLGTGLKRVPARFYRYVLIFFLLAGIALIVSKSGVMEGLRLSNRPPSQPSTSPPGAANAPEVKPRELGILIKSGNEKSKKWLILEFKPENGETTTTKYTRSTVQGLSNWDCASNNEKEFFRTAFHWEIESGRKPYIQKLQESLSESDAAPHAFDGVWGAETRNALLEKAWSLSRSGGRLELFLPNGDSVRVIFRG